MGGTALANRCTFHAERTADVALYDELTDTLVYCCTECEVRLSKLVGFADPDAPPPPPAPGGLFDA